MTRASSALRILAFGSLLFARASWAPSPAHWASARVQNPATVGDMENSPHLFLGRPGVGQNGRTLIARRGYACLHDSFRKVPLWVSYRLTREDLKNLLKRPKPEPFKADPDLKKKFRAELTDYRRSGWDRGHMAPSEHMSRDVDTQAESYFLSNIAPQNGITNNQGFWRVLEGTHKSYAERFREIYVIVGPIFDRLPEPGEGPLPAAIGNNLVSVPTHFYRIVVRRTGSGKYTALAFIVPNREIYPPGYPTPSGKVKAKDHEYEAYQRNFLRTIDEIEAHTGLDFCNALPVGQQSKFESKKPSKPW